MVCVHVIGAGLAGLSAAVRMARRGHRVRLYEAAPQAGGRCRSFFDSELGLRIDNGNHLLVSGNDAAMAYITEIGAASRFRGFEDAMFPFTEIQTGERWTVAPNDGLLPCWVFAPHRSVPGMMPWHYLEPLRLRRAPADATVGDIMAMGTTAFRRLWRPLCVAALNTEPEAASASLFWRILADTFGRGGAAMHPVLPTKDLSQGLVDPALQFLESLGAETRFSARLRGLSFQENRVTALLFPEETIPIDAGDLVVLATPPMAARELVPDLTAPDQFRAIVNVHYVAGSADGAGSSVRPFVGTVGGNVDWIFFKNGIISTTTSAATDLVERAAEEIGPLLWADVARATGRDAQMLPKFRVVKEKRATFAATPEQLRKRPAATTRWTNLLLAGDWTDTGWPATIEGAVRSGFKAADIGQSWANATA
jgi:squalene-associated FAD-dependent desaturase